MPKALTTDSDKIRLIPEMVDEVARLNKILITGEPESNEPGLLENVRNIRKDVREIRESQPHYFSLEKRVKELEMGVSQINSRHAKLDKEAESGVDRRKRRVDAMMVTLAGVVMSNIAIIIMIVLGFVKK